ncbi:P-loop containing nucleoside triphosphate hydrolase protein [Microdochium trichocladiopsis]|uniref:RNA helicase n=1 Tax=Microdochium trichocladiopsis TaxID=1682393 RepID=A0A9P8YDG5_9PEZI|nr:P-loop containing nucleoside triphosphate hydrolase protein [Microdochium trichocladiopsis]KAH7037445.1 P-loop containing nucleoside triphosphate hydrolase protein [Microdochium trichocladiopsis]
MSTNGQTNGHDATSGPPATVGEWAPKTDFNYEVTDDGVHWEHNARVYEWDGDEGEVGPEHPELEAALFGPPEERGGHGINFAAIAEIKVEQVGVTKVDPVRSFDTAGLHPAMLKNVQLAGYRVPTPIQMWCIPAILQGHDLIAIAQTGSGKTAAYLIPILSRLMGKAKQLAAPRPTAQDFREGSARPVTAEPLVVIVCPARELAVQIFNEARKFCYRSMLRPCVVYGGGPLRDQIAQLQRGCDVLIASPGRLVDFMERPGVLSLRRVKYMVIDEADEMLDDGWRDGFTKIMSGGEQDEGDVKYMMFSATFPAAARQLAKEYLTDNHVRLQVGRIGSTHSNIKQDVIFVARELKQDAVFDMLTTMPPQRTIIFVNSKHAADQLDDFLFNKNLPCTSMHGDRTQREREDAMRSFRAGTTPILITTGVTARGIDVRNVMHVINYDLPSMEHGGIQEYIHRIGRTGRIGYEGRATSFYNERDEGIAPLLTMTLLETKQEVPDFLSGFVPEGGAQAPLVFDDDSDDEGNANGTSNDASASGWGTDAPQGGHQPISEAW